MSNGCPVCLGLGRLVALGASTRPFVVLCPECAGLAITPASAEDPFPEAELRQTGPASVREDPDDLDQSSSFRRSTSRRKRP